MEGLNEHLRFQIKLAGKEPQGSQGGSNERMGPRGTEDVPDIAVMVPIEKVD